MGRKLNGGKFTGIKWTDYRTGSDDLSWKVLQRPGRNLMTICSGCGGRVVSERGIVQR